MLKLSLLLRILSVCLSGSVCVGGCFCIRLVSRLSLSCLSFSLSLLPIHPLFDPLCLNPYCPSISSPIYRQTTRPIYTHKSLSTTPSSISEPSAHRQTRIPIKDIIHHYPRVFLLLAHHLHTTPHLTHNHPNQPNQTAKMPYLLSHRQKTALHIIQLLLVHVAIGFSVPRLFMKNQPRTRANTIALGMVSYTTNPTPRASSNAAILDVVVVVVIGGDDDADDDNDANIVFQGAKSIMLIFYQILTENVQMFKRWASLKANMIINCLEVSPKPPSKKPANHQPGNLLGRSSLPSNASKPLPLHGNLLHPLLGRRRRIHPHRHYPDPLRHLQCSRV